MSSAHAQTPSLVTERAACDAALSAAAGLIKNQDTLIEKLTHRADEKQTQNDQLTKALVEMNRETASQTQKNITYGISGVAIGIISILLLKH